MTVNELISILQRYPGDTLVMLRDWDYIALSTEQIESVLIRKFECEERVWGEVWDDKYVDRGPGVIASKAPVVGVLIS